MRKEIRLNACYQCGECTAVCPMRRVSNFSPREFVSIICERHNQNAAIDASDASDASDERVREEMLLCLLCGDCLRKCPQNVDFPQFIMHLRSSLGVPEEAIPHRELSLITEIMSILNSGVPTDFKGEKSERSEIGYFPGCLAYFDLFMDVTGVNYREIGDYSVKLLNKIGIKPRILPLKCCGHDALFQGKREIFEKLREYNTKYVRENGIKMIVCSCAECYYTFKRYYEMKDVEIVHIAQILAEHSDEIADLIPEGAEITKGAKGISAKVGEVGAKIGGEVSVGKEVGAEVGAEVSEKVGAGVSEERGGIVIAYHDPCAFKMLGEYESAREVLRRVCERAGFSLVELPHARENALCCGVSGMMFCNDFTKALRTIRMNEVRDSNVNVLVTTCVKCLSHLNCLKMEQIRTAASETEEAESSEGETAAPYNFEIVDLSVFLGKLIERD